jgi:hypothetical protein
LAYVRGTLIAIALTLPTISLVVLGSLWLWQEGWLLQWSVAASAFATLVYGFETWLLRGAARGPAARKVAETSDPYSSAAGLDDTYRQAAAMKAVEKLGSDFRIDELASAEAFFKLGRETVESVAHSMNPEAKNPVWNFTVPEALVVIERASKRLQVFMHGNVPFGDRLTVGQLIAIYRWRSVVNVAERAYDVWRIIRMFNPANAVAGELRDRVSQRLFASMRAALGRRMVQAYVKEVGLAAIELYSEPMHAQHLRSRN